jgi:hypothetical protein
MVNANIDIFEMTYEESVSYFKRLDNLEKIRRSNGPNLSSLPVDRRGRLNPSSLLKQQVNLNTSSDEGEKNEYLFTYSKPFSSSKIISPNNQSLSC